ncbi:MAG: septum formation protein Maf [Synergistetes bacterium]|nr:septum formation protein Maf [Synergistota bacterium]
MRLILASSSPRRQEILSSLGILFDVVAPDIIEERLLCAPYDGAVVRIASEKVVSVKDIVGERVILAADTVVVMDDVALGKPTDMTDAERMLKLLSGREHSVITGLALYNDGRIFTAVESTKVWFCNMSDRDINFYLSTDEPIGKAGGYAIQGYGSLFIKKIEGCYFNVVGLPVFRLRMLFQKAGIDILDFMKRGNV